MLRIADSPDASGMYECSLDDDWNPTEDEIRAWAYAPDLYCPVQDWELVVIDEPFLDLIFELASDSNCPNKQFFLFCLYTMVGSHVRSCGKYMKPETERLILRGATSSDKQILLWSRQARELLAHPKSFQYHLWCGGELAFQNRAD